MKLAAILCVALFGLPAVAAEPLRLLVAFGTNQGLPAEQPLRYAEADAARYADTLHRLGNLPRENQILVTGGGHNALESALADIAQRAKGHDGEVTLFFYFSGHGDDKNLHIGGRRFPLVRLRQLLSQVPASLRVSVIDACRGEGDTHTKGFSRTPAFAVNLRPTAGVTGAVTLRSSSSGETSQESKHLEGAVFTHYFTTALGGAADRDQDNRVTLEEAYAYAYRQTVRRSARGPGDIMHPSVDLDLEGAGQLVLTRPAPADAVIVLPKKRDAQFLVFDGESQAVEAEVWASPQRAIPLRVRAGRYLIHRRDGARSGAMTVTVRSGEARPLRNEEFQLMPEQLLASKGGQLQLIYQTLSVGYSAQLTHTASYGQSVNTRYTLGGVYLAGSIGLELGQTAQTYSQDLRNERWVGGDFRLRRPRLIGPVDGFVGATWRVVSQDVRRQTSARLVGTTAETSRTFLGVGAGGTGGLSWSLSMGPRWGLSWDVSGTLLVIKEGADFAYRPEGRLTMDVVTRF